MGEDGTRIIVPDEWLAFSQVREINFRNEVALYKQAARNPRCEL